MRLSKLRALWILGIAFLKLLVLSIFVPHKGGRAWLGRLAQERIGKTPATAWQRYGTVSRCIGCGLCDAVAGPGMSRFILGAGRIPSDAPLLVREAVVLERTAKEISRVCPTGVRADDLAMLLREQAAILEST